MGNSLRAAGNPRAEGRLRPCQFLDPELVRAAPQIEQWNGVSSLERRYRLGPAGQRIRDAFQPAEGADDGGYRVFWSRAKDLRTTMEAVPEQSVIDKKERLAADYRGEAGHVLLAARFRTDSGRLLSIFSVEPSIGSMWVPIQSLTTSVEEARVLCAWFNSTPGVLGCLMRRGDDVDQFLLLVRRACHAACSGFPDDWRWYTRRCFRQRKAVALMPFRNAAEDDLRDCLDHAAAQTTGIDIETIRDWRQRLTAEPTVTNARPRNPAETSGRRPEAVSLPLRTGILCKSLPRPTEHVVS